MIAQQKVRIRQEYTIFTSQLKTYIDLQAEDKYLLNYCT